MKYLDYLLGGDISKQGYKDNSPYKHLPYLDIASNNITMKGVSKPLVGISDEGDTKIMKPGKNYTFKGTSVREFPVMQKGGYSWNTSSNKKEIVEPKYEAQDPYVNTTYSSKYTKIKYDDKTNKVVNDLMSFHPYTAAFRNLLKLGNNEIPSMSDWVDVIPFGAFKRYYSVPPGVINLMKPKEVRALKRNMEHTNQAVDFIKAIDTTSDLYELGTDLKKQQGGIHKSNLNNFLNTYL